MTNSGQRASGLGETHSTDEIDLRDLEQYTYTNEVTEVESQQARSRASSANRRVLNDEVTTLPPTRESRQTAKRGRGQQKTPEIRVPDRQRRAEVLDPPGAFTTQGISPRAKKKPLNSLH